MVDNLRTLKTVSVISLIVLALVAFALGFYPLQESASRGGLGIPMILPVLIDLGLVLMGLGAMAARANQLKAWPMRLMAVVLILVSACVQYFHATMQPHVMVIDIVVAVLPPIVLWSASSAVETLLFGKSVENAVSKAEHAAARQVTRQAAKNAPKAVVATATPPTVAVNTSAVSKQVEATITPREVDKVSLQSPAVRSKSTPAKSKPAGVSDKRLDEAVALVLSGEPARTVAREYEISRSTLGRKVEAARNALN